MIDNSMTKSFPFRRPAQLPMHLLRLRTLPVQAAAVTIGTSQHVFLRVFQALVQPLLLVTLLSWQASGHARGLQAEEQHVAALLASQVPWAESAGKRQAHPLGVQTLFIERQESKQANLERRARVYQYDYTSQAARMLVIDLDNQAVLREQGIDSVHLPLSEQEIAFAKALLAQDDSLLSQLRAEQSRRNAIPFVTLDELDVKASIYEPLDSNDPCSVSRCALLSLFDASSTVFTTEPLIYLSRQQVGELHRR